MNPPNDIANAQNPDLRASLTAMRRAARLARQAAMQTDTGIVIVQNGVVVRVSAAELREDDRKRLPGDLNAHASPEPTAQQQGAWQAAAGEK